MASIITAGNATNGLALSSDGTGTLNIKTGTGTGTNAITIDASQNVTVTGTLTGSGSITGTNLFGQGQTWQYVTSSRAIGTTYTNTTNRPIMVAISIYGSTGGATGNFNINGFIVGQNNQGSAGATVGALYGVVPPGVSYNLTQNIGTIVINVWAELR